MLKDKAQFVPNQFYHIYNRTNDNELLFRSDENYRFFLSKIKKYTNGFCEIWSYCLLPNHFHFLIKTTSLEEARIASLKMNKEFNDECYHFEILQQFINCCISYVKSFNKYHNRRGSLLSPNLKRRDIRRNSDIAGVIFYIHKNPIKHGLVDSIEKWKWSSYHDISQGNMNIVNSKAVQDFFSGVDAFGESHKI